MKYIHDIMHCDNEQCKLHNECYRYNAYLETKGVDMLISLYKPKQYEEDCKFFTKDDIKDETTRETE